MITSTSNVKMKHIAALTKKAALRREEKVFLVEGPKMAGEVPVEQFVEGYVSESFAKNPEHRALIAKFSLETVSDSVMAAISDTKTPQGVLMVVRQPEYTLADLLPEGKVPHLVVLDTLQDPGNLGTILRTGEGAGITGVLMNRSCVDIFNPKVVRSTMGAMFRVPFYYTEDLAGEIANLKAKGVCCYAAHLQGAVCYDQPDYTKGTAFFIGNESAGLSDEVAELADIRVKIPMEGKVESLNAAVAAALFMYETARQRRNS